MYIAAMTKGPDMDAAVAPTYQEADCLLIIETETARVQAVYRRGLLDDCGLAKKIVEHDCEAVLCGPVEEAPFVIIADEGCVTRYLGSGLTAAEALKKMEAYQLEMIPDFIGGTGCGSGDLSHCSQEHT